MRLVSWWRDHGHPTLFARPSESALVRASLDFNVVRDLAEEGRTDREESLALMAEQMADRLELVRTPALDVEIDAVENPRLRDTCLGVASPLRAIHPDYARLARIHSEVRLAADARDPAFRTTAQGRLDVQYVAEAIAGKLNVFVTRDQRLADVLGSTAAEQGLRILRPAEVIVRIDELVREEAYRPAALQATAFRRQLIPAGQERALDVFVDRRGGEAVREFQTRLRALTIEGYERVGIFGPDSALMALVATRHVGGRLHVAALRVLSDALGDTLARQLLFVLRLEARDHHDELIRISDPFLTRPVLSAAIDDGYLPNAAGHYAYVIDVCGQARDIHHAAIVAARADGLQAPSTLRSGLPRAAAAEIERAWWPAKVMDSQLMTYMIPIRPSFATQLLGYPAGLFHRPAELGLSREQVYYRSPQGPRLSGPARIVWYMSGSSGRRPAPPGVVAVSLLDEVVHGSADELDSRFRHLGVWRKEQIEAAARKDVAQALRFVNTEILTTPIPLKRVRELVGAAPQGPLRITADVFAALYEEGRR